MIMTERQETVRHREDGVNAPTWRAIEESLLNRMRRWATPDWSLMDCGTQADLLFDQMNTFLPTPSEAQAIDGLDPEAIRWLSLHVAGHVRSLSVAACGICNPPPGITRLHMAYRYLVARTATTPAARVRLKESILRGDRGEAEIDRLAREDGWQQPTDES